MLRLAGCLTIAIFLIAACGPEQAPQPGPIAEHEIEMAELEPVSLAAGEKLKVVATTNIVADIVSHVGDDQIELTALLPIGADPHTFAPTPRDAAAVADAHVVFANGLGLEEFLDEMLENAGGEAAIVHVSRGIEARQFGEGKAHEHEHEQAGVDPHTWTTPANVLIFVHNIEHALSALDPANTEVYEASAQAYEAELEELDVWVKAQIETIPAENRELVTDHTLFGYYTDRYGLEQIGAVIPAFSTGAEPSARELAALEDAIGEYDVRAIFVGTTVNPSLTQQVAEDTGIQVIPLYTGSLGPEGSGVETYVDYICYDTTAIVEALGGTPDVAGSPCQ